MAARHSGPTHSMARKPPRLGARARGPAGGTGEGVHGAATQINALTRPAFQARQLMVRQAAAM
jgi:hypothetical protein